MGKIQKSRQNVSRDGDGSSERIGSRRQTRTTMRSLAPSHTRAAGRFFSASRASAPSAPRACPPRAVTFLPVLYSKMNMNRNRCNPLKTNNPCTLYSIIKRVFDDPARIVVPPIPSQAPGSEHREPRGPVTRHHRLDTACPNRHKLPFKSPRNLLRTNDPCISDRDKISRRGRRSLGIGQGGRRVPLIWARRGKKIEAESLRSHPEQSICLDF